MKINQRIRERKTELSLNEKAVDDREDIQDDLSSYDTSEEWDVETELYDPDYRKYLSE